jgi:hypothetical protein
MENKMKKLRRYGEHAGSPNGHPEDLTRCVVAIFEDFTYRQCRRKRGYGPNGLFCKQHANKVEAEQKVYIPKDE